MWDAFRASCSLPPSSTALEAAYTWCLSITAVARVEMVILRVFFSFLFSTLRAVNSLFLQNVFVIVISFEFSCALALDSAFSVQLHLFDVDFLLSNSDLFLFLCRSVHRICFAVPDSFLTLSPLPPHFLCT